MTRSQLVFGPLFVAVGVLLLLDRAGTLDAWSTVADWWPSVIILAGLSQFVTRPRNTSGGLVLTVIGGVLLLWRLGTVIDLAVLGAVVLIGFGLWMLVRRPQPSAGADGPASDMVVLFDDRDVVAPPGPLGGYGATTIFGDLDIDLRAATLIGSATMQLTTIFGDVDIEVPAAWRVTVGGPTLLGDVTVTGGPEPAADAPTLHLQVLTVFGDVDVRRHQLDTAGTSGVA